MEKEELISIITAMYNASDFIEETIESVINQSYKNWELIIVDDLSTDNSREIVDFILASDHRIRLIRSPTNQGPAGARNTGIEIAKGKYLAFLDSDDIWHPEKLTKQLNFMHINSIPFSYTSYEWINENGESLKTTIHASENATYNKMLNYNQIGCLTAIYDCQIIGKRLFKKVGHEDYILWLSIIKDGYISKGLDVVLAKYRIHQNSVSTNKFKVARFQWNIYRDLEKLSLPRAIYHFTIYTAIGIYRRCNTGL